MREDVDLGWSVVCPYEYNVRVRMDDGEYTFCHYWILEGNLIAKVGEISTFNMRRFELRQAQELSSPSNKPYANIQLTLLSD